MILNVVMIKSHVFIAPFSAHSFFFFTFGSDPGLTSLGNGSLDQYHKHELRSKDSGDQASQFEWRSGGGATFLCARLDNMGNIVLSRYSRL